MNNIWKFILCFTNVRICFVKSFDKKNNKSTNDISVKSEKSFYTRRLFAQLVIPIVLHKSQLLKPPRMLQRCYDKNYNVSQNHNVA